MIDDFRNSMNQIYKANRENQGKKSLGKSMMEMKKVFARKRKSKLTDSYLKTFTNQTMDDIRVRSEALG